MKDKAMQKRAGERLREVREIMKLSQAELGGLIGFSREMIIDREAGRREIRPEMAANVCKLAHERGIDWLTGDYLMGISDRVNTPDVLSINDLVRKAHANAVEKGFWAKPSEFGTLIALMHDELSEALREARDGHAPDETYFRKDGKPEGIPSELADVVIRVFDVCGYYGINLEAAIVQKMEFNKTRPEKHGKRF